MKYETLFKNKMADESALKVLEWKVSVARKELNNLRRDVNSLKRMFIQKITEVKESLERGNFITVLISFPGTTVFEPLSV